MRILDSSNTAVRPSKDICWRERWFHSVMARGLWWAALVLAIVAAGAIWYRAEGRSLVLPWLHTHLVPGRSARHALPTLVVEIDPQEMERLAARRQEALQRGILRREEIERIAARVRFQDRTLPVVLWLPEGPTHRWQEQRWDLAVDLQDGAALLELGAFSARPVDADTFLNEWLYVQDLRDAGIVTTRPILVNLSLNGEDWGLYVLRDLWAEEWLDAQDRHAGAPLGLTRPFRERPSEGSQAFDAELLGQYLAHANLWGARHGLSWPDEQTDCQPSTAGIEPIGQDARPLTWAHASFLDPARYDDRAIIDAYVREAARISRPDYLESLRRTYAGELARYKAALAPDAGDLEALWDVLAHRQALLAAALRLPHTVHADKYAWESGAAQDTRPDSMRPYPAALRQFDIDGRMPILPSAPSVQEALERHPFLTKSERPGMLAVQAGTWQVKGDLVLPEGFGLEAAEPVTLAFERQAMLLSRGPLLLHGTTEGSIRLVPQGERWAGLVVHGAGPLGASSLTYVEIRSADGVRREEWVTTGGVTFIESPVVLERCRVLDSPAPDAVHVVRAHFEIAYTEFGHLSGDALAVDDAQGQVVRSVFHDVLGDGIDASKSRVDVQDSYLIRIYDRAISAGEGSVVQVQNVHVTDAGVAVSASDRSHVQVVDLHMSQVWLAGLAAYRREPAHGPSGIQATRLVSGRDVPLPVLAEPGSRIVVDGMEVEPSAFDVKALHWREQTMDGVRVLSYHFGEDIRLVGYRFDAPAPKSGDPARLALYWQALGPIEREYTVFVHVLDASGQLVAQRDAMPRDNKLPTTHWLPGRVIEDLHALSLPQDLDPGTYQVAVGLYNWMTGERLPVQRLNGEALPNGVLLVEPPIEIG